MHDHMIKKMAAEVAEATEGDEAKIEASLREYWLDRAAIVWTTEDVMDHASDSNKKCGLARARIILKSTIKRHDASVGVSWDSFDRLVERLDDDDLVVAHKALCVADIDADLVDGTIEVGNLWITSTEVDDDLVPKTWGLFEATNGPDPRPLATSANPVSLARTMIDLIRKDGEEAASC